MVNGYHCEADAVVGDALVDTQFIYEGTGQSQMDVVLLVLDGNHASHRFYYSGKHKGIYDLTIYYLLFIYDLSNLQFNNLQCTIDLQFSNIIIYYFFSWQYSIYDLTIYYLRFIYDLVI